jgi:hypothetical protein
MLAYGMLGKVKVSPYVLPGRRFEMSHYRFHTWLTRQSNKNG